MKQYLFTALFLVFSIFSVSAQHVMKVEKWDGSLEEIPTSDIKYVSFSEDNSEDSSLKQYDKSKCYFTVLINENYFDGRTLWSCTNIKDEKVGSCYVNWGDGTGDIAIVDENSFKHAYKNTGIYEIAVTGLTGVVNNLLFRKSSVLKDAKFGTSFVSLGEDENYGKFWILNDVELDSVTFFSETPFFVAQSNLGLLNKVERIVVPEDALLKYMDSWYKDKLSSNKDFLTCKIKPNKEVNYIYKEIVVTVGNGGDFDKMNDAISYMSKFYPLYRSGGVRAVVKILKGTVISEEIVVTGGVDLSWITIEYEDYDINGLDYSNDVIAKGDAVFDKDNGLNAVPVDASSFSLVTHDTRGDVCLFRAENGSRLPTIACVFKLTEPNVKYGCAGMVCNRGSAGIVKPLSGFIGFNDGVISNNGSSVIIREGITIDCSRWGCHSRHNGEICARSVIATNCGFDNTPESAALSCDRISDLDGREAFVSAGNVQLRCNNASRLNCNGAHIIGEGVTEVTSTYGSLGNYTRMYVDGNLKLSISNGATMVVSNYQTDIEYEYNSYSSDGIIYLSK